MKIAFRAAQYLLVLLSVVTAAQSAKERSLLDDEVTKKGQALFTDLFLDKKKASDHVEELRSFTWQTPYDFKVVMAVSYQMLSIRIPPDEAKEILLGAMEASAALDLSEKDKVLMRVVAHLCEMYAENDTTWPHLTKLQELGLPVFEIIGAATDLKPQKVTEMSRRNQLRARPAVKILGRQFYVKYRGSAAKAIGDQ
ncbi:MAG TPA: hypothetical protein VNQ79_05375 [Blastocatellia bacterium]|nr:hypothetical protein [Blastocatellia bacterium]